jgi:hypothetical protein
VSDLIERASVYVIGIDGEDINIGAELRRMSDALAASQAEVARLRALLRPCAAKGSPAVASALVGVKVPIAVYLAKEHILAIRAALTASQPQGDDR